ncbi:hypothetical protein M422DRAFT_40002, partial [Sphaerobolus stellatus SS14]
MFGTISPELRNPSLEAERYPYKGPKQRVFLYQGRGLRCLLALRKSTLRLLSWLV